MGKKPMHNKASKPTLPSTPEVEAIKKELDEFKTRAISGLGETTVNVLVANGPRFTESEIEAISKKISAEILQKMNAAQDKGWQDEILRLIGDLLIGIAASGVWELISFFMTHKVHAAGPETPELSEEEKRREQDLITVRNELERGLDYEAKKDLENGFLMLDGLSSHFIRSFYETVGNNPLIRDAAAGQAEKHGQSELANNIAKAWSWDIGGGIVYGLQAHSIKRLVARAHEH